MNTYRPNYGNQYGYPPPPPPPPANFMPPLPSGPPPSYDPYRGRDSYRPPQSDFSYRNTDPIPGYPRDYEHGRSARPAGRSRQANGRAQMKTSHRDTTNLNQARRGNHYQPRQNHRTAPADRPLLRHQDEGMLSEQMLGTANGQKFLAAEDILDSDEERMDELEPDPIERDSNKVHLIATPAGDDIGAAVEELEPPTKRRAVTSNSNIQDGTSEPRWSNPDPYTVLPPVDESSRKRKDVVKLIRRARKDAEETAAGHNQVTANDDFISFGMEGEEEATSKEIDRGDGVDLGAFGAPTEPREFSHLHNLHHRTFSGAPRISVQTASIDNVGTTPRPAQPDSRVPEEIVLDFGRANDQHLYTHGGDENLGSRKRTYDDSIKSSKKNVVHNNGSILHEWRPMPGMDPVPWLQRTDTITANAGFRLHKEICDFYDFVQPKDFEETVRQDLLSRLQAVVNYHLPNTTVMCFGSFAAGLYLPNADMDVVIISNSFRSSGYKIVCQGKNQMWRFARFLEDSGFTDGDCEVVASAKVPIVKFVDRLTGIKVDVSFENDTGIVANDTFASWKSQYPAMPVLVTIIKQFLMMRGLNEVQHGGLGGFSVTCLVTSLLQNLPRVQSGDVIPEQHLGEMLLEFFDFYGNRLDLARTGIMMQPPRYCDKQNLTRSSIRGPTYKANNTDRLAIMDPNKPDNDISGGSREVTLIFDRFARAHQELLQAMKTPGRISLLDWALGGNYECFAMQRNHLLGLYREKWGSPADPVQYHFPEMYSTGDDSLHRPRGGESVPPGELGLPAPQETRVATSRASRSKPKTKPKSTGMMKRAAALKVRYPDMEGIPDRISKKDRSTMVEHYNAKKVADDTTKKALQAPTVSLTAKQKGENRARALRKQFPDMQGISKTISKKKRASLIAIYENQKNTNFAVKGAPSQMQLRQRPLPALQQSQRINRPDREHGANEASNANFSSVQGSQRRPISNKMAPLSNERRAEVARHLSGGSNVDPITLD